MTDSNDTRTKEQLLAEIEALRDQLAARGSDVDKGVSRGSSEPIFSAPITRRELFGRALATWVSPVVLSVPVVVAAITTPGTAHAATSAPTPKAKKGVPTMVAVAPTAVTIPGLGVIGLAALGSALAASGAKLLKDHMGASDADESKHSDESGGNKGSK